MCDEEQWDIYKLDPDYDCVIHPQPALATITRRAPKKEPHTKGLKRHYVEDTSDEELLMPGNMKKPKPATVESASDEDSDDDEIVEMLVDPVTGSPARPRWSKEEREKQRKARRQKNAEFTKKHEEIQEISMIDLTMDEPSRPPTPPNQPPSHSSNSFSQPPPYSRPPSFSQTSSHIHPTAHPFVPTRPMGMAFMKRSADTLEGTTAKRRRIAVQDKKKSTRWANFHARRTRVKEAEDREFMAGLRADVPPDAYSAQATSEEFTNGMSPLRCLIYVVLTYTCVGTGGSTSNDTPPTEPEPAQEEDPVSLEEKIRRVQEINDYERGRRIQEEARRFAQAAQAERKRKQEEDLRRKEERAERERERQQREREREKQRRQREQQEQQEQWHREEEQRRRRRQQQQAREQEEERFSYGRWTPLRALERYKTLADAFDTAKFTAENPITFETIPWPVLHKPYTFTVAEVDWASVEEFFAAVRDHLRTADYKALLEKSHRRFHPDRWRARRVLQSVQDNELRECLEVTANTVAQALTPLWSDAKEQ